MKDKKLLNARVVAQIKNIYKVNEQDYAQVAKLEQKVAEAQAEIARLKEGIELSEQRVKNVTGGYTSADLIEAVVTPLFNEDGTPKMDKEGKYQQKSKKYVCKYPETILPIEHLEEVSAEETPTEEVADALPEAPAVEEPTL